MAKTKVLRREFLVGGGTALAAGALTVFVPESAEAAPAAAVTYEPSTGYIVYDSRLCLGCQSCMFACSMTHEGEANPSVSRIQIIRQETSFAKYPYDIVMSVCRQCVSPLCVQNCPTGACHVDAANGNVRRIDEQKCIGCKRCINSCPQRPHRTVWNRGEEKIHEMRPVHQRALLEPAGRPQRDSGLRHDLSGQSAEAGEGASSTNRHCGV